jgi:flagellar hook-associated protein 2
MATTSSLGIGTGIDLQSMLTKLMAAERAPITALDTKIAGVNTKISLYGTLKAKLDALKSAAETLQYPSKLSAVTATSTDSTIVGANAVSSAAIGSYNVEVTSLASAQKSVSKSYVANTTFGTGDLTFTVGSGPAQTITTINFATGSNSLQDVSTRINAEKIGVTATVINTSDGGQRMVLTSSKSGAANGFSLTSTLPPSNAPGPVAQASLANFEPTTGAGAMGSAAKDAVMTLDGVKVSSSTNQFSDPVSGLTFTAVKLGTATVSVQNDSAKITAAAKAFVDSYNAVATTVKSNSGYDVATKTGKAFSGDAAARSVMDSLGSSRTTMPTELSAATYKTLAELGITVQQTGQLSLDSAKLTNVISSSPDEVIKTLSAYGKSFAEAITEMQKSDGTVGTKVNALNDSVKRFQANQETLTARLVLVEKRYRAQFTALDRYVSSMNTTSAYLSKQFA